MYIPSTPIVLPIHNSCGKNITLPQDPDPEFDDAHKLIESLNFNVIELLKYGYQHIGRSSCDGGAYLKNGIVIKQMYTWRSPPKMRVPTRIIHRYGDDRYIVIQFFCERPSDSAYSNFYRSNQQLREDYDLQTCNVGNWRGEIVFFDW